MINLGDEYIYHGEVLEVSLITPTGMVRLTDDPQRTLFKPWTSDYDVLIGPRCAAYGFRVRIRQRAHRATPERLAKMRDEARTDRLRKRLHNLGLDLETVSRTGDRDALEEAWAKHGGGPLEEAPTDAE